MSDMDRPLTPAETARRFGVTIKALRVYEARGLLTPLRASAGATRAQWRAYGPHQLSRLHQILALKRMGLSLARIGEILAGPDTLATVLALQADALVHDREKLSQALVLVQKAQAKLAGGQALSIDDLANLSKETVVTKPNIKDFAEALKPFADRHISPEEKAVLKAQVTNREQIARDWEGMMAEWQTLMQSGDHTCLAAQDMARRWSAFVEQLPVLDAEIRGKQKAVMEDVMNDPAAAEKLAMYREIGAFAKQAIEHWKALAK